MPNNQKPSKTAYTLAVQIKLLSILLREKSDSIEAVFAEFPTEEQIYANESGAKNVLIANIQNIRGHLSDAIDDIDALLKRLRGDNNINALVAPDELKKIAEFGG